MTNEQRRSFLLEWADLPPEEKKRRLVEWLRSERPEITDEEIAQELALVEAQMGW